MAEGPKIKAELVDELLAGRDAKSVFERDGLLDELRKALAERILNAEMDHHLGQEDEQASGNHRNGTSPKTASHLDMLTGLLGVGRTTTAAAIREERAASPGKPAWSGSRRAAEALFNLCHRRTP